MARSSDKDKEKEKNKKKQSALEAEIFALMQKSLKAALDAAMKDLFKDFK